MSLSRGGHTHISLTQPVVRSYPDLIPRKSRITESAFVVILSPRATKRFSSTITDGTHMCKLFTAVVELGGLQRRHQTTQTVTYMFP